MVRRSGMRGWAAVDWGQWGKGMEAEPLAERWPWGTTREHVGGIGRDPRVGTGKAGLFEWPGTQKVRQIDPPGQRCRPMLSTNEWAGLKPPAGWWPLVPTALSPPGPPGRAKEERNRSISGTDLQTFPPKLTPSAWVSLSHIRTRRLGPVKWSN